MANNIRLNSSPLQFFRSNFQGLPQPNRLFTQSSPEPLEIWTAFNSFQ